MQDYDSQKKPNDIPAEGVSKTTKPAGSPSSFVGIYEKPKRSLAPMILILAVVIILSIIIALLFFGFKF